MKIILITILIILTSCSPKNPNEINRRNISFEKQFIKPPVLIPIEISLGEATTSIIDSGENRVSNIMIACNEISGKALLPGEEFSFNNLTGIKTEVNGYKYAPVLIDGEKTYGLGGGVCQVSTTIYQAALNAGLEITEQHCHSKPVAYAKAGNDATVAFGLKDLKFKNNTQSTLYVYAWVGDRKVFSKIVRKGIKIQE